MGEPAHSHGKSATEKEKVDGGIERPAGPGVDEQADGDAGDGGVGEGVTKKCHASQIYKDTEHRAGGSQEKA